MNRQLFLATVMTFIVGMCAAFAYGETAYMAPDVKTLWESAINGDAVCQRRLGLCYANGNGVAQDYTNAVKWFRKAAEQGDATAQFNIGICYYRGDGVARNDAEAVRWHWKAASQGNAASQDFLRKRDIRNRFRVLLFAALAAVLAAVVIWKWKGRKRPGK